MSTPLPIQRMAGGPMQFSLVFNLEDKPIIGTIKGNDLERIVSSLTVIGLKYDHYLTPPGYTFEFKSETSFFHCLYLEDKQKFILTIENVLVSKVFAPVTLTSLQLQEFLFGIMCNLPFTQLDQYFPKLIEFRQNVMIETAKRVLNLAGLRYFCKNKSFMVSGEINFFITLTNEWFVFSNEHGIFKRTNQASTVHKLTVR